MNMDNIASKGKCNLKKEEELKPVDFISFGESSKVNIMANRSD